jgi:hypothetical protein
MELHHQINYWAVLLCGVVGIGLGAVWYSHMFLGKVWVASLDKSEEEWRIDLNPFKTYLISFLSQIVMAFILALIMSYVGVSTPEEGIKVAFMAAVGFIATSMTINFLFEGKTFQQFVIDAGYHFIVLLINGIILGAWQV